ncbi:hypothetical protein Sru01_39800 [Sphaerisporangium rufum]|uniref:Predicted membrane protein YciQ-like C-terminal domain-containing protein n=1 Tax=Sphaerisporangium rufum TaxID=1381558 RepID=A0A919R4L0_9ACTN|nr:DUF2207 domain-containing protein [Sphaerisporangium rufum]GII78998.1 hypothetical protein Sru01_39800 [Sphaerisporangium rufum]
MLYVVIAAGATGLWLLLLTAMALATRSPRVSAGPPTAELRPESPALVDLITGGWRLCEEATSATLLDLAARGVVQIEEVGPELSLVRLPGGHRERPPLTAYEKLVLDHVTSLATGGVVATGALAEGSRHLGRWWSSFRRKVIAEARAAGLSRSRWSRWQAIFLTAAAAVPGIAIGVAVAATADDGDKGGGFGAAVIGMAMLTALMDRFNGERGTAEGARVAGHWLGVRAHLAATGRFPEQPAAAVTIWGRHLAYAAALGLARRAVAGLPVSVPADDGRAWSDHGGMWHVVNVRYPRRVLWGRPPWPVLLAGPLAGLAIGFWLWVIGLVAGALLDWPRGPLTLLAQLGGVLAAAVPIGFALADLATTTELVGRIVRLRAVQVGSSGDGPPKYVYWVALDDGRNRDVKALGIAEADWRPLAEGDVVRLRVGRRLGWVQAVETLERSRHRGSASYDDTGEHTLDAPENLGEVPLIARRGAPPARPPDDTGDTGDDTGGPVTRADVRRVLGVRVGPPEAYPDVLPIPGASAVRSYRYRSAGGTPVTVDVHVSSGPRGAFLMMLGHLITRVTGRQVPGIGGGAMLYPGVVAARTGSQTFAIRVHSPAGPPRPDDLVELARLAAARLDGRSPVA